MRESLYVGKDGKPITVVKERYARPDWVTIILFAAIGINLGDALLRILISVL